ncbi:hypothetical protein ACU4GR_07425 [Methylobacterium oryzae CBMB20]
MRGAHPEAARASRWATRSSRSTGFQGAEPREFALTRASWVAESRSAGLTFEDVPLTLSFRSTGLVLRAVDAVFALDAHNDGPVVRGHGRARPSMPARDPAPPARWSCGRSRSRSRRRSRTPGRRPVDAPETSAPAIVTARRVAQAVRDLDHRGATPRAGSGAPATC